MRYPSPSLTSVPTISPDDPRCQPDAYISLDKKNLYEVTTGWERTGPDSGTLHVVNSKTGYPLRLTAAEAARSRLERAAPVAPTAVPEDWDAPTAA